MLIYNLLFGVIHLSLCLEPRRAAPLGGGTTTSPIMTMDLRIKTLRMIPNISLIIPHKECCCGGTQGILARTVLECQSKELRKEASAIGFVFLALEETWSMEDTCMTHANM